MGKIMMRFPEGKTKALTLSYDDGVVQDIRMVKILNRYGLKATFNINTGLLTKEDNLTGSGRMSVAQAKKLYTGTEHEVAVHGYTHPFFEKLPVDQCTWEILRDRACIEEMFGKVTRGCAYPYGSTSDGVVQILKDCGIVYARTTVSTGGFGIPTDWLRLPATCHHSDERLDSLCDTFLNTEPKDVYPPMLFYLWGHTYEFDFDLPNNNWGIIEKFAEKMGGHDEVWYATNIEVCDYVNAYRSLRFSLNADIVENPTSFDIWFTQDGVPCFVGAGETKRI